MALKVGSVYVDIDARVGKLNAGLRTAQKQVSNFGKQTRILGTNISNSGKKIALAGAGITATFGLIAKKSLSVFMNVNQQLRETKSLIGPTGASFKQLDKIVSDLGLSTKFTQQALANGLRQIASAGKKEEKDMRAVLSSASDLASAIGTDLNTAISHTLGLTESFGKELGGTSGAVDVMANLVKSARIESDGLGDILKYATGVTKAFGGNIKDSMALIAGFAQVTGDARMGAVGLRNAMGQLSKGTDKQKQVLERYGLTVQDVNPEVHGLINVVKKLKDANLTGADAVKLLGVRAMNFLKVAEQTIPQVDRVRKALDEQGSASRMAKDNLATLKGQFDLFTSSIEALWKQVGGALAPAFTKIFQIMKKMTDNTTNFITLNKNLISGFIITGGAIGVLLTTMGGLLTTMGFIIKTIPTMIIGFKSLRAVISPTSLAIGVLVLVIGKLITKYNELKGAIKEQEDAQALAKKGLKEQQDIMKRGFELRKQYTIGALKGMEDENKALLIAQDIAKGYFTSIAVAGQNMTAEEKIQRREVAMAYLEFYDTLKAKRDNDIDGEKNGAEIKKAILDDLLVKYQNYAMEIYDATGNIQEESDLTIEEIANSYDRMIDKGVEKNVALGVSFSLMTKSMKKDTQDLFKQWQSVVNGMTNIFQATFAGTLTAAFVNLGRSWKGFADGMQSVAQTLVASVRQLMFDMVAKEIALMLKSAIAGAISWLFKTFGPIAGALMVGGAVAVVEGAFRQNAELAEGGIVTGPTQALIGEAGPEAVIPLDKAGNFGMGGGNITVNMNMDVDQLSPENVEETASRLTNAIRDGIDEAVELSKTLTDKSGDVVTEI